MWTTLYFVKYPNLLEYNQSRKESFTFFDKLHKVQLNQRDIQLPYNPYLKTMLSNWDWWCPWDVPLANTKQNYQLVSETFANTTDLLCQHLNLQSTNHEVQYEPPVISVLIWETPAEAGSGSQQDVLQDLDKPWLPNHGSFPPDWIRDIQGQQILHQSNLLHIRQHPHEQQQKRILLKLKENWNFYKLQGVPKNAV